MKRFCVDLSVSPSALPFIPNIRLSIYSTYASLTLSFILPSSVSLFIFSCHSLHPCGSASWCQGMAACAYCILSDIFSITVIK